MAKEPTNYPSDAADKYVLRFPDGMRERLKQAAAVNNRTLNAEIVARLSASFDRTSVGLPAEVNSEIAALEGRAEILALRVELARGHLETIQLRCENTQERIERLTAEAKTDEDFEQIEKMVGWHKVFEQTALKMGNDIDLLLRERDSILARSEELRRHIKGVRFDLERRRDGAVVIIPTLTGEIEMPAPIHEADAIYALDGTLLYSPNQKLSNKAPSEPSRKTPSPNAGKPKG